MIGVKVCGITDLAGLRAAVDAGADAVGFVLAQSVRQVTFQTASRLCHETPPFVTRVAVLRWPDAETLELVGRLSVDLVQLYPPPGAAWPHLFGHRGLPAFCDRPDLPGRVAEVPPGPVLLDGARAGHGETADWSRLAAIDRPVVLAGGLAAENVATAIRAVNPVGVDVSTGVESSPGVKDPARVRAFVQAVREVSA